MFLNFSDYFLFNFEIAFTYADISESAKFLEEFVLDFVEVGSITPIDIVMEITGLTYEEVKSCSEILVIDYGIQNIFWNQLNK